MEDFWAFRRMATPILLQIVFWLGLIACIIASFIIAANSRFLEGLAVLIFGPLAIRVYCELLILFFRMNETLTDIRDSLLSQPRTGMALLAPTAPSATRPHNAPVPAESVAYATPRTAAYSPATVSAGMIRCQSCGSETPTIYSHCRSCRAMIPAAAAT